MKNKQIKSERESFLGRDGERLSIGAEQNGLTQSGGAAFSDGLPGAFCLRQFGQYQGAGL